MEQKTWVVYMHIFPNGKRYIGVTGEDPEKRWGNGLRYKTQQKIFREIIRAGWDNVQHEIVGENLTQEQALITEQTLIKEEIKNNRNLVLNVAGNPEPKLSKSLDWRDSVISNESCRRYTFTFMSQLDDEWMENYRLQGNTLPFDITIYFRYVEIVWYTMNDKRVSEHKYRFYYPESIQTFRELWVYLQKKRVGEWVYAREWRGDKWQAVAPYEFS